MCYAAIRWARIPVLVFSATRYEASHPGVGFSDEEVYEDMSKNYLDRCIRVHQAVYLNSLEAFEAWKKSGNPKY